MNTSNTPNTENTLSHLLSMADEARATVRKNINGLNLFSSQSSKTMFLSQSAAFLHSSDGEAAYKFLESRAGKDLSLSEEDVKKLYLAASPSSPSQAVYRTEPLVIPGTNVLAASPDDLPQLMRHLPDQILSSRFTLHPIELAAMSLKRFIDISPFKDNNRETAVLLMDLILVSADFLPFFITDENQKSIEETLDASRHICDMEPLSILVAKEVFNTFKALSDI